MAVADPGDIYSCAAGLATSHTTHPTHPPHGIAVASSIFPALRLPNGRLPGRRRRRRGGGRLRASSQHGGIPLTPGARAIICNSSSRKMPASASEGVAWRSAACRA